MVDPDELRRAAAGAPPAHSRTLRLIAALEAAKGLAAFAALLGLIDLMHHDVRRLAMELIGHFNLNPDARYPSMLLHYASLLPGADLRALVLIAMGYIVLRTLEAYGLWNDRTWAEWLGALSGGLYVPFEFAHLAQRPSLISAAVLMANIFVVVFLLMQLGRKRKAGIVQR